MMSFSIFKADCDQTIPLRRQLRGFHRINENINCLSFELFIFSLGTDTNMVFCECLQLFPASLGSFFAFSFSRYLH